MRSDFFHQKRHEKNVRSYYAFQTEGHLVETTTLTFVEDVVSHSRQKVEGAVRRERAGDSAIAADFRSRDGDRCETHTGTSEHNRLLPAP